MKKALTLIFALTLVACALVSCKHEHKFTEWLVTKNATCTEEGVKTRYCDCDENQTEAIPATGHTEVIDAAVDATCTETGLTEGKHCSVCNERIVEQEIIQPKSHTFVDGICAGCGEIDNTPTSNDYFVFTLLDDGTYSVAAKDVKNMPKIVVIPSEYNGAAVTQIADYAFFKMPEDGNIDENNILNFVCQNVTSIVIPDSVTHIGEGAFDYCISLANMEIPDSVTSIGDYAFYECYSLTSIVIPDSVTSIGSAAFYKCRSLTSIEIPDSVTSIGEWAFSYCDSLTSIVIPDSVTSIANQAFFYCDSLTNIVIPDSVTNIGDYAFLYCDSLTSIVIPDSVTSIGDYAFYECDSLTSIVIPDSVTSIGSAAFKFCSSLTDVYFTGSEEKWDAISIGDSNTSLTNATIHYNYVPEN